MKKIKKEGNKLLQNKCSHFSSIQIYVEIMKYKID